MKSYIQPLAAKAVATLRSVPNLDWRIMPMNEAARPIEKKETQAQVDRILHDYLDYWITCLKGLGVPAYRIVLSITGTNTRAAVTVPLLKKYPGVIEQVHGPNSDTSFLKALSKNPGAEIDGDGFDPLAAGYKNDYGFALPSIAQCKAIRALMIAKGIPAYETFNGHAEGKAGPWQNIEKAEWAEQRALAGRP
jgi:hypothetical protein